MGFQNLSAEMLTTFVAISDAGSISKASEALFVDQSSISRRIRQLELELNVTLFERSSKGVKLTSSGTIFYEFAQKFIVDLSILSEKLDPTAGGLESIRIGTFDSITSSIYPHFFGNEIQHLKQVLISNDTSRLIESYNDRLLDAIIVDTDFESEIISPANRVSLFSEPYYVVYSLQNKNEILFENSIISAEMLKKMEIFLYPSTCPIHRKIVSSYKNMQLPVIHQLEFSSSSISFVMHTAMVTILPKSVAINYVTRNMSKLGMRQLESKFDRYISLFTRNDSIQDLLLEAGLAI